MLVPFLVKCPKEEEDFGPAPAWCVSLRRGDLKRSPTTAHTVSRNYNSLITYWLKMFYTLEKKRDIVCLNEKKKCPFDASNWVWKKFSIGRDASQNLFRSNWHTLRNKLRFLNRHEVPRKFQQFILGFDPVIIFYISQEWIVTSAVATRIKYLLSALIKSWHSIKKVQNKIYIIQFTFNGYIEISNVFIRG